MEMTHLVHPIILHVRISEVWISSGTRPHLLVAIVTLDHNIIINQCRSIICPVVFHVLSFSSRPVESYWTRSNPIIPTATPTTSKEEEKVTAILTKRGNSYYTTSSNCENACHCCNMYYTMDTLVWFLMTLM